VRRLLHPFRLALLRVRKRFLPDSLLRAQGPQPMQGGLKAHLVLRKLLCVAVHTLFEELRQARLKPRRTRCFHIVPRRGFVPASTQSTSFSPSGRRSRALLLLRRLRLRPFQSPAWIRSFSEAPCRSCTCLSTLKVRTTA